MSDNQPHGSSTAPAAATIPTTFTTRPVPLGAELSETAQQVREALHEIDAAQRRKAFEGANIAVIAGAPPEPTPAPAKADDGRPFWPVFTDAKGKAVPAWTVADLVRSGDARIDDDDLDASWSIVEGLRRSTHGGFPEADQAYEAINAERRLRLDDVKARFDARFPDGPRPPVPDEYFLTVDEVADIFRVSAQTVARESGQSLPAPIMVGSQKRYRATAIAAIVNRVSR